MVSQSVAEMIAAQTNGVKVLYLSLNGRESTEYVKETPVFIDSIKNHIENKMLNGHDFLRICMYMKNLYMLAGICNELEERHYHPEMAIYLLEEVAPEFDLIIADCGNDPDNGLAVGGLSISCETIFVMTQQESALKRYEKLRETYDAMGVHFDAYLVNKFFGHDPYSLQYIAERLQLDKGQLWKIEAAGYSMQAEMDYKTLLDYKSEKYSEDVTSVANHILSKSGFEMITKARKRKWKSFI